MPIYTTLREALQATRGAPGNYKSKVGSGPNPESSFIQSPKEKLKPKPAEVQEPLSAAPIALPEGPKEDPTEDLQAQVAGIQQALNNLDINSPAPIPEPYKKEPSLIRSLAFVELIDRKNVQILHGAQTVQRVKGQQNTDNWLTRGAAKRAANAKKIPSQIAYGTEAGLKNQIAHPIANAQNMFREPFERREISFSDQVNEMIKEVIFPDNHELALKLPDEFIEKILKKAQENRNKWFKKPINAVEDLLPNIVLGFNLDTQQKRAIEYLKEIIKQPDSQEFKDLKEASLNYSSHLARGFSLTLTDGKKAVDNQTAIGNKQILLPGESRYEVPQDKNLELEKLIKEVVLKKFFEPTRTTPPTPEEELEMIRQINEAYREVGLVSKKDLEEGEFANDIILELKDMLENKDFFHQRWADVHFINYTGKSKGEALGGQERFTINEKYSLKIAATKNKVSRGAGTIPPAIIATGKAGISLWGFAVSGAIGAGNFLPRWAASSKLAHITPLLGPAWAAVYGASTEALDSIGPIHIRESRVTSQQRQVSQAKALGKNASELDYVRQQLEREATVTPIPASELTKSITDIYLSQPDRWNLETKKLNQDQVLALFMNLAHAKARLEATHQSGSKELKYTTQNWISYQQGSEQRELTNLKASFLQGYSRLMNLKDQPDLFKKVPFYDPNNPKSLDTTLKAMTDIIGYGLKEGFPLQILQNSPLGDHRRSKFYKQIFSASGFTKEEIAQGEKFIASLKDSDATFGGKTIAEWLDQSESFKERNKSLKRLKNERAVVVGSISAVVGAALGLAKTQLGPVVAPVMHEIGKSAQEHVIQPVLEHVAPSLAAKHQPAPAVPETVTQSTPDTKIDFSTIFTKNSSHVPQQIVMWDKTTNAPQPVAIPLAAGYELRIDNAIPAHPTYDLVKTDGTLIYNDFLVENPSHHGSFAPNSSLHFNNSEFLKTESWSNLHIEKGGEPISLGKMVDNYRLVWGDVKKVIPDKDYIFKTTGTGHENHPYGIEIKFAENTVSDPNTGVITTLQSHYQDGSMAAALNIRDYFGPGKDGQLLLNNCIDRLSDGHYSFKLDPTSDKILSFANGTKVTMAQVAQILLNEKELLKPENHKIGFPDDTEYHGKDIVFNGGGYFMFGYKVKAPETVASSGGLAGHNVVPGGSKTEIFQPVYYMKTGGELDKSATITPPGIIKTTPVIEMLPPQPVDVAGNPIPIQPIVTGSSSDNFSPLPGPTSLPQLHPTTGENPIPASSTPIPKSIIDSGEFKKEQVKSGYTAQQAKQFLETIVPGTGHERINDFIDQKVFNETQQEFIHNEKSQNFIKRNIYPAMKALHPEADRKIHGNNQEQLTNQDKKNLKETILDRAKAAGLTEREALTVNDYLIHRSYLTALGEALIEKRQLDDQLRNLQDELTQVANSTPIQPRRNPNQSPETAEKAKQIDNFTSKLVHDYQSLRSEELPMEEKLRQSSDLENDINQFIFEVYLDEDQVKTMNSIPDTTKNEIDREIKKDEILINKMQNSQEFDPDDLNRLRLILSGLLNKKEAEAYYSGFTTLISISSQVREKMEAESELPAESEFTENEYNGTELLRIFRGEPLTDDIDSLSLRDSEWQLRSIEKNIFRFLTQPKIQNEEKREMIEFDSIQAIIKLMHRNPNENNQKEIAEFTENFNKYLVDLSLKYPSHTPLIDNAQDFITANQKMLEKTDISVKIYQSDPDKNLLSVNFPELKEILPANIDTNNSESLPSIVISKDDLQQPENGGGELKKSFIEYEDLSKKIVDLTNKIAERTRTYTGDIHKDSKYNKFLDVREKIKSQLKNSDTLLSEFEKNKLPIILGTQPDNIIKNGFDVKLNIHNYYYGEFRIAFRQYMADYIVRGHDADNADIRIAFNKLKGDLNTLDPSVKFVRFEEFMDAIRAVV